MKAKQIPVAIGLLLAMTGCATNPQKYSWGGYEKGLYQNYKNPASQEDLAEKLAQAIESGEQKGNVPPGIYAEYGYLLYTSGKKAEAVAYFEKEKAAWPESSILMDKMIKNAQTASSSTLTKAEDKQAGVASR